MLKKKYPLFSKKQHKHRTRKYYETPNVNKLINQLDLNLRPEFKVYPTSCTLLPLRFLKLFRHMLKKKYKKKKIKC